MPIWSENFDALALGPSLTEIVEGQQVWTKTPPTAWAVDDTLMPSGGVPEWRGWAFAAKSWWVEAAGNQERGNFSRASGVMAVADPDEWDDLPRGPGLYHSFLLTPTIIVPPQAASALAIEFDSSWRPEGFDVGDLLNNQTARIEVAYNGGAYSEVLHWDSNAQGPFYKPAAVDERVRLTLNNPAGTTQVRFRFGLTEAANDWWWAIDNLQVFGGSPPATVSIPVSSGFSLIGSPLSTGSNTLSEIIPEAVEGTTVYPWNVAAQGFGEVSEFFSGMWTVNHAFPPGVGFYIQSPVATSIAITGVETLPTQVPLGPGTSLLASPYAHRTTTVGELFSNTVVPEGSTVSFLNASGTFSIQAYEFGGWSNPGQAIAVGQGFFFTNPLGSPVLWNPPNESTPVQSLSDAFSTMQVVTGLVIKVSGPTSGFSREALEPRHAGNTGGKSGWIAWRPPMNGIATIKTSGSDFDTVLAVYTGTNLVSLIPVAADDDGALGQASLVRFNAIAGTTYRIAVDGYFGAFGSVSLASELTPGGLGLPTVILVREPATPSVLPGTSVTLNAVITPGVIPATTQSFQWFFNGTALPGQVQSVLSIPSASITNVGGYVLRVQSNGEGFSNAVVFAGPEILQINTAGETYAAAFSKYGASPGFGGDPAIALLADFAALGDTGGSVARGFSGAQIFSTKCIELAADTTNPCEDATGPMYFEHSPQLNGELSVDSSASDFAHGLTVWTNSNPNQGPNGLKLASYNQPPVEKAPQGWLATLPAIRDELYAIRIEPKKKASGTVILDYRLTPPELTVSIDEGGETNLALALGGTAALGLTYTALAPIPPVGAVLTGPGIGLVYRHSGGGSVPEVRILFQVSDGLTTSQPITVTVTVNAVNDPPTLADISNPAAITEDAEVQTVNLTGISAGDGESQVLTVTATSDNTNLIPDPTVTYTSPNPTGTLTYTPVRNASGTARITVKVDDKASANNLTTRTFTVTVNAVNDPPTLADISNPAAISEDAEVQTVNLTGISAGDGESQVLTVTATSDNTNLIPDPTVTYTSPNPTGTLTYTPVRNASGTAHITVKVDDKASANNLTTRTFTVTVNAVNDAPSFTAGEDLVVSTNAGPQSVPGWATTIQPGPVGEAGQTLHFEVSPSSDSRFITPPRLDRDGTLHFTPGSQPGRAQFQVVLVDDAGIAQSGQDTSPPQRLVIEIIQGVRFEVTRDAWRTNSFRVRWPSVAGLTLVLESADEASANWTDVPVPAVLIKEVWEVNDPVERNTGSRSNRVYRLRRAP